MNARNEILSRIRAAAHPAHAIPPWKPPISENNLVTQFAEALKAAKGKAHLADNLEHVWEILRNLLESMQASRVVASDQPPFNEADFLAIFPETEFKIARGDFEVVQKMCLAADVGLTTAQAGLAQTGSVVIHSG